MQNIGRARAHRVQRPGVDVALKSGCVIVFGQQSVVRTGVGDVRIIALRHNPSGFASADIIKIGGASAATPAKSRGAGDRHGGIILLRSVQHVGITRVRIHVIELGGRLIIFAGPRSACVVRDRRAAVITINDPIGIRRIDPESVIIAVRAAHCSPRAAAVNRTQNAGVQHIHNVSVFRVGENVMEIPRTLRQAVIRIHQLPGIAAVFRAIHTAARCFNNRVHTIAIRTGN